MGIDHLKREVVIAHPLGGRVGHTLGDAEAAADAVLGRDLDPVLQGLILGPEGRFEASFDDIRGVIDFLFVEEVRTDGGVGADEGALVALDAVSRIPDRHPVGDGPFLAEGDVLIHRTIKQLVLGEGRGRELIAVEPIDDFDVFVIIGVAGVGGRDFLVGEVDPFRIDLDLAEPLRAGVDGIPVVLDDVHAFLRIGLLGELLHPLLGFRVIHDRRRELEEGGLEGGVGMPPHMAFGRQLVGVDDVELGVLFGQQVLHPVRHRLNEGLIVHVGVKQEGAAIFEVGDDVELEDIGVKRAGDEVGVLDVIFGMDRILAEAEVAPGRAAGFPGVVLEIGLGVLVSGVPDDLDRALVGRDGAVAP